MYIIMCMIASEERINNEVRWAKNNGIYFPKLQVGHVNGMRGLSVTKHIKKGGLLMSIPRQMALSVREGGPCPFPMFMGDAEWGRLPEYDMPLH